MSSFTIFSKLLMELQVEIWSLAGPEPEPEVCIVWPLHIKHRQGEKPVGTLVVDTSWPVVARVCHIARETLLLRGQLRLRYSPAAGFFVPFRAFNPAIDTLYWSRFQIGAMRKFIRQPANLPLLSSLRHIAVDLPGAIRPKLLVQLIRESAISVRTISIVLPASDPAQMESPLLSFGRQHTDPHTLTFLPPAGRCRLRDIPADTSEMIAFGMPGYLTRCRTKMDNRGRKIDSIHDSESVKDPAWDINSKSFSGLEIKFQTFIEYAKGDDGRPEWFEPCGDCLTGDPLESRALAPVYIPVGQRQNPEEYRVLEDDSEYPAPDADGEYPDNEDYISWK